MKFFKYLFITVIGIAILSILIPTFAFAILHYWLLTPEQLTSSAQKFINEYTLVDFNCKKIELDYLSSWPSISLAIYEGEVKTPTHEDSIHTQGCVTFQKVNGNIQLSKILTEKSLQIEDIFIKNPKINILKGEKFPQLLKQKNQSSSPSPIKFNINQINVTDAELYLKDYSDNLDLDIKNASFTVKGDLTTQNPSFNLIINCNQIGGNSITSILGKEISFSLNGYCKGTDRFNNITLSNTSFYINQFPFHLNGNLYDINKKGNTRTDLTFKLLASSLKEITDFIPNHILPEKSQYLITGNTMLEGNINGYITNSSVPDFNLKCILDKGSIYKKDINKGIDTISLCMNVCYMKDKPDSCFISLNNTKIRGLNSHIEIQSHISNLQKSPFINVDFNGHIDFDRIGKEFISPEVMELKGKLESNLSVAFNLKDLKEQNLSRIWTSGTFKAPYVKARSEKHNLDIFVANTEANIGYKKNKSDFIKNDEVLSTNLDIDTLKIQYNKSVFVNLSQLELRSNTALSKGNKASTPVTAHLICDKLQAKLGSEKWINAQNLKVDAGSQSITFSPKDEAACIIQAEEFQYIDLKEQNAIEMNNGEFIAELHPGKNLKWDFKGLINYQEALIYTSDYPIEIRTQKGRVSFMNNQIAVNHLQLNVGESDCLLSGILTTNNNPQQGQPKIEGSLHLLADYINYDELKMTLLYHEAAEKEFKVSNIQNYHINELNKKIKNAQKSEVIAQPMIIPEGIDLTLNVNINHMNYEEIDLNQVNGTILIKEKKAYTNLSTRTNLGKVSLDALYNSQNPKRLQTQFDLKLQDVLIAQIHNTVPTISTLFPMVESMDGLIDCHLTLSSQLDNQMLPIIEKTEAICSITGQNLTLMDHDVFKNLAKKLKFKNKEKNIIDYLSTNIILQNNQIEVIPFQIKWDRYEAVVGGTHTTDFTYNYHVSMLKSPIPFDLGVNLSGKTNEMHYKLSKPKFKELYKDGGIEHNRKTQKRLNQKREAIIKNISLL